VTCPQHGVQEFRHVESASIWVCVAWMRDPFTTCCMMVADEDITPDGVEVVNVNAWRRGSTVKELRMWEAFGETDKWTHRGTLGGFGFTLLDATHSTRTIHALPHDDPDVQRWVEGKRSLP
jgi:hypothetical protein